MRENFHRSRASLDKLQVALPCLRLLSRSDAVGMGSAPAPGAADDALVVGIGGLGGEPICASNARGFGARARRTAAGAAALPRNSTASILFTWSLIIAAIIAAVLPFSSRAMEIQWTRMAGQWPVEASALVVDLSQSGKAEILALNRGGQMMLWTGDGASIGSGQDGVVTQLPEGRWTTVPTLVEANDATRLLVVSVEGLVVGLDENFQLVWQHKLPGETGWGRATPAILRIGSMAAFALGDGSGTISLLAPTGKVVWTNALDAGPIKAPPQIFSHNQSGEALLVAAGSTLFCLDDTGQVRWRRDLGKEILTRPEVLPLPDRKIILCGTISGSLFAISVEGDILWECATRDTLNNSITFLPRTNAAPLILCPGLWGNLHAIDVQGRPVWTHLFRTKTRATPLVFDSDGDGHYEIFLPTFHQHVYAFDENGGLVDDIRLSGIMPSALTSIVDTSSGRTDLLVTTTTLLAYRLRLTPPKSPYGKTGEPQQVSLHPPDRIFHTPHESPIAGSRRREEADRLQRAFHPPPHVGGYEGSESPALQVHNPNGALINVKLSMTDTNGWMRIVSSLTARSAFEIPYPALISTGAWTLLATAHDVAGHLLDEKTWKLSASRRVEPEPARPDLLRVRAAQPYGSFDETALTPFNDETEREQDVALQNLYQDEADQGAFIITSTREDTVRARVTLTNLLRTDGVAFGGTIVLREELTTGSVNGERVPDALPKLGDAGLVTIPPRRSVKIWVSVDTRGATPGNYTGRITVASLHQTNKIELPLSIEVVSLRLPKESPLTLCTWDYVPNRWFPAHSKEVLDDMARHGVNVFPRSTIPPARCDASDKLTIDWSTLDAELERLQSRGKILFHLNHPPIEFVVKKSDAEKRPTEIAYILALRNHLRERGRGYEDYAFYLLDEPGLDYGVNLHVLLDSGQLFRDADRKLLTYTDPVPTLSWKDFERIEPLVDVWAPNMRLVSGLLSGDPRIKRIMERFQNSVAADVSRRQDGKSQRGLTSTATELKESTANTQTVWSYECVSQVKSLSPLRYNRANAWRAKFFGLSGIGFWTHSTTEVDHWFAGKTINDEYALVYPGELPVPSVRWEAVRDGLEDVSAIALLEQAIQRQRQSATKRELVEEGEEVLRIALRDIMELSDETFLESRDFLREGDRALGHTPTDVETFRRHRAEIARLTLALSAE